MQKLRQALEDHLEINGRKTVSGPDSEMTNAGKDILMRLEENLDIERTQRKDFVSTDTGINVMNIDFSILDSRFLCVIPRDQNVQNQHQVSN